MSKNYLDLDKVDFQVGGNTKIKNLLHEKTLRLNFLLILII